MTIKIIRTIAGVLGGYIVFALASMTVIMVLIDSGNPTFPLVAVPSLAIIGIAAGFVSAIISGETRRLTGYIVAGLVFLATVSNLVMQLGIEPIWYKLSTIALTIPSILFATLRLPRKSST